MKKFCEFSREQAMKINNFKKKKVKLLTPEQQKSCENAKIVIFVKNIENKYLKITIRKVRDHCHYTGEYRVAVL